MVKIYLKLSRFSQKNNLRIRNHFKRIIRYIAKKEIKCFYVIK